MADKRKLCRDRIVDALVDALKPLDYVHALYEGGAAAFNRIDEWSDIDVYAVVDDEKVDQTFLAVEYSLQSLAPIIQKHAIPQTQWAGVSQAFYKLRDASEYLAIDLAVIKLTAPDKFLESEIHGNVRFYFNKSDKIKPTPLDTEALAQKIQQRLETLQARLDMFGNFVQKEINRGNYLEAADLYHNLVLASLIEVLRINYYPFHYNFRMRYIHYELPSEVIDRLQYLYFVRDEKDLRKKYLETLDWFRSLMKEIGRKDIENRITSS